MKNKVIIVGGGASGLMAALSASDNGADVIILERNDKIGRKILATGNGRCNFTNINATIDNYHGNNPKFPYSAFSQFDVYQTMYYFENIGISPYVEENGKVFPASLQSSSIIDVFLYEIESRGIELKLNTFVKKIDKIDGKFNIRTNNGNFESDKLILATGGRSLANTGSDGNGYNLAKNLGHKVTEIFPGIVQLYLDYPDLKQLSGVRVFGIADLYIDEEYIKSDKDDILFTDYGISGPTILQLSRTAIAGLKQGKKIEIGVQLIIDRQEEELFNYLSTRFKVIGDRTLDKALVGLINKKIILPMIKSLGMDKNKKVSELTNEEIRSITSILKSWKFRVTDHRSWEFAQVTAGGVDTKDIDNTTMESKLIDDLYIVGELLDVDGDCGGYNLQWAWSSGYLAGMNAALVE